MKNYVAALLLILVLTGGILAGFAAEKTEPSPYARIEILDHAAMEKLAKRGAASEQSHILASLIGEWNYDLRFWAKKGAEPQLSTGSIANEMIFNHRFLFSETNVILNIGGQNIHYKGKGFIGYDTIKNVFQLVWLDSIHTGMTIGTGTYDEKRNVLEEKGHFTNPLLDGEREYRSEIQFTSSESYKITIYLTDSTGQEYKAIEIEFRRKR